MTPRNGYEAIVLAALPGTNAEIVKRTGLGRNSVRHALDKLRATKRAYISGAYKPPGASAPHPIYSPGSQDDVGIYAKPLEVSDEILLKRARQRANRDIAKLLARPPQQWYSPLLLAA